MKRLLFRIARLKIMGTFVGFILAFHDKVFWEDTIPNLINLLAQNNLSENSFSILIHFDDNVEPLLYFI
ncbi:MAG: hypothetical protein FWF78_05885 [Defluviitaleaceae bacterium]|nr:hypothetical protein [Defluviitaleaceae bacterium]